MFNLFTQLANDEAGFIVSAELVLVATIAVLALIVGLSEVAIAVNQELEDVGSAVGSANQSYHSHGFSGHSGESSGSRFRDRMDFCDSQYDIVSIKPRHGENSSHSHRTH
jgi:hypothetical protein